MRRPLIGGEDFETSIGQREQAQGKVMKAYQVEGIVCVFFFGRRRRRRKVWGKKKGLVLMCEKRCCSWERCVQELSMKGFPWQSLWSSILNSCSSQIHRWICVKLKKFLFRRCRRFSPNFSIIGLVGKELHLPEVEGVVVKHGRISITKPLEFYFK